MTLNTDAPNTDSTDATDNDAADAPNASDNDAAYPKLIQLSLRNQNHKIALNTPKYNKKNMNPNTNAPDADAPDAADNDVAYPYSWRNQKKQ